MATKSNAKKPAPKAPAPAAKGKAVATVKKTEVGAAVDMKLLLKQDSGKGVSTAAEDNIIPLIYILQAQSPQCLKQKPECIKPGIGGNATAVAGNIWPRGTKTLIDGEETGMPFIPVAFKKWWMEWGAERGDGMFGRHAYDATAENKGRTEDATWIEDPKKPGKGKWERENGHILVETREHVGLAYINDNWTGAVVSMKGSDHTSSRMWMGMMKDKRIPDSNDRAPSFAYVYNLKTIAKSNDEGDWYGIQVEDGMGDGEVTFVLDLDGGFDLYKTARQLNADFESGAKVADIPDENTDDSSSGDDENI